MYEHGVKITESATQLIAPIEVGAPLTVIGTSVKGETGQPVLIHTLDEYKAAFGWNGDFTIYTLEEAIDTAFNIYNISPVICISSGTNTVEVFEVVDEDEATSTTPYIKAEDAGGGLSYTLKLSAEVATNLTLSIADATGATIEADPYRVGTGYECEWNVTADEAETMDTITATYFAEPTDEAIKNAIDGLEQVYPKLGLIPGIVIVPKYGERSAIAAKVAGAVGSINESFKAFALLDVVAADYQAVQAAKPLTNENVGLCWPQVTLGGTTYHLSTHAACLALSVDAQNGDIPFESPSNKELLIDGAVVTLTKPQATYLNGVGVVTAMRFAGMQRLWGNRTAAYPTTSDPLSSFIACRRMMSWIGNSLVTTYFSQIDQPVRRRTIERILDSANDWLNGLAARQIILGGRVTFMESENPATDLIDGVLRFHVYVGLSVPARVIEFTLEFDPAYYQTLFE